MLEKLSPKLDEMMDQLHGYYSKLPPNGDKLDNPRLHQPCIAKFTEDNGWYRAIVTGKKLQIKLIGLEDFSQLHWAFFSPQVCILFIFY